MFSFFKSSKKSPAASPSEKTDDNKQKSSDDFVLLGGGNKLNPDPNYRNSYPNLSFSGSAYPGQMPPAPMPHNHTLNRQFSITINYTANVPFKLNPALMSEDGDTEIWDFKIRELKSELIHSRNIDYDFRLERTILEQS